CTPKPRSRLRDLPGIRGRGAGKSESGWLFDDENTAVIGEPLGTDLGGVPRQGDNEPDSAAAGKKSSVERAWGKKSLVERASGKKVSEKKSPVALKDEIQGPLVILTVLAAIVAIVGGLAGNSFLALAGGLMSGAALLAVIILGLTTPK
ncbi:MAG: hypothetical protein QOD04_4480, partial [Pseudonocardiales bacterium]|nr:hypothetical protein [Pseudonocardiales bacterium]